MLGLRMLYLNTVQALGRGGQTTEELQKLIERVDREKQRKARERLSGQSSRCPRTRRKRGFWLNCCTDWRGRLWPGAFSGYSVPAPDRPYRARL